MLLFRVEKLILGGEKRQEVMAKWEGMIKRER